MWTAQRRAVRRNGVRQLYLPMMRYANNEHLLAIRDFLANQSKQIHEYVRESKMQYESKPDGKVRMNHQWARRIGDYVDWLITGVEEAIKDE